jgi:TRAP-type C4-dicarboxylate transport system substrate-binding protein
MTALRMVATIRPMIFINADFWKSLPQELREIMIDLNKKWTWEIMMPAVTEEETRDWKLGKEKGLEIIKFSQEETAKVLKISSRIGRDSYLNQSKKQGYGDVAEKLVAKMAKATEEWPTLERKLLKEGIIKSDQYMYPAD